MSYCNNCGAKIVEGAKFCQKCGHATIGEDSSNGARKQEFSGKIYKCPYCGAALKSFEINCPVCGGELRGVKVTSSVQELALKLEAIESRREVKRARSVKERMYGEEITKTDEQKISLIRSFPIPNTKEDLYEFLILAESNIDVDLYGNALETDARIAVSNAWKTKFEQAYQKAKMIFKDERELDNIQVMYDKIHKEIKKSKNASWRLLGYLWGGVIVLFVVLFVIVGPISIKKENSRLEDIVDEIEQQLECGEYKYALMNAENLEFSRVKDKEQIRKWKIQREYWIDRVIEEALKNGVKLEYTIQEEESVEENRDTNLNDSDVKGGFIKGIQSGTNEAKENIDKFNRIMNGEKETDKAVEKGE